MEKINLWVKPVLKIGGLAVLGAIILYAVFVFLGSLFGSYSGKTQSIGGYSKMANYDSGYLENAAAPMPAESEIFKSAGLSSRNAASSDGDDSYIDNGYAIGNQAEKYEVTDYNASIETGQLEKSCAAIGGLKSREDVIFESAREYRNGCSYSFKVNRAKTDEILALIKEMDPKELSGSTYTIQRQVDDYTSRIDILQKKLASIDETLNNATGAYDDVTQAAAGAKDIETLAKVIDSKINTIERLTQQRISINSQLEQIRRGKAEQVDRLNYTYFSVNIVNGAFIDFQNLGDSWNLALKVLIAEINQTIQNISINLIGFMFILLQYAIYAFILLIVAKYGWKLARRIWQNR